VSNRRPAFKYYNWYLIRNPARGKQMDIKDYRNLIEEIIDFEIEMSSIAQSRKTLLELNERRELLLEMQKKIKTDMRSMEVEYLNRRSEIREAYIRENENPSRKSRFLKKSTPSSMRAKAMKHLESERKTKIDTYEDINFTVDDLILQVEDVMVEVYSSMKNFLGNQEELVVEHSK
jgi:hypothetical protein